jgi:hypothetical protein
MNICTYVHTYPFESTTSVTWESTCSVIVLISFLKSQHSIWAALARIQHDISCCLALLYIFNTSFFVVYIKNKMIFLFINCCKRLPPVLPYTSRIFPLHPHLLPLTRISLSTAALAVSPARILSAADECAVAWGRESAVLFQIVLGRLIVISVGLL